MASLRHSVKKPSLRYNICVCRQLNANANVCSIVVSPEQTHFPMFTITSAISRYMYGSFVVEYLGNMSFSFCQISQSELSKVIPWGVLQIWKTVAQKGLDKRVSR